jgi:plasmid stability protein
MKTTIDLPDDLYKSVKVRAAQEGRTVREIVVEGIRLRLHFDQETRHAPDLSVRESRHFYVDEEGWPVLKRTPDDTRTVTDEMINELREQEGV